LITTIEELSMNAWPSLQTWVYDGWVLRFAGGYTRRANSVYPLYAGRLDISEKIAACEKIYQDQGLPVVFKLTPANDASGLDRSLEERGYRFEAATSVQCLDLASFVSLSDAGVELSPSASRTWQEAFTRLSGTPETQSAIHARLLGLIVAQTCYAGVTVDGQLAACGLGVLQNGYLGLFDIVTAAAARRQGLGERIVRSLLAWGKQEAAHTTYLQVMLNNPPALNLYAKIGYRELYQYWYRVK
jgi:N-acetylglutamate synthase